MESFSVADVHNVLRKMASVIVAQRDYLNELDGKLGDADFGTSIAAGFSAVEKVLPELAGLAPGTAIAKTGATLLKSMGGASGPLFGTIFMKSGKALGERQRIGVAELAEMLSASLAAVKALGKSDVGDKTLIDALQPATLALVKAAAEGHSLKTALTEARDAAAQGVEATKAMVASRGRAHYVGERAIGHQDAGATAISLLFGVLADYAI
jgi:phosphoenolpyruvate---glycerone phosphotransferase subunit DhaL